jgi:tetratricopeptide (TPR) repeat protein
MWLIVGALVSAILAIIVIRSWNAPRSANGPDLPARGAAAVAVMPFDVLGALSKALGYAERAAAIDHSVHQIHFVKAQVALFRGRHEQAAAAATRVIELSPNYADAYALLAWILHDAGRPDQAELMLAQALERNPRSSASFREIAGEIAFATGRYEEAAAAFAAALERNPAHARAALAGKGPRRREGAGSLCPPGAVPERAGRPGPQPSG